MEIEELVAIVRQSAKYRTVCPQVIARIGRRELALHRHDKEAVKATKNKLHQIAGAYLDSRPRYAQWLAALTEARQTGSPEAFQSACRRCLEAHASTRERLPFLPEFFPSVLAPLGPIHSVLDVGCGLNPLAFSWMPLAPDAVYRACDIHEDMMTFLEQFFALIGLNGQGYACDAADLPSFPTADVALLLKVLPVLEQQDRAGSLELLRALPARALLVSFPTRSLGGSERGMAAHYEARFRALVSEEPWTLTRFAFATELCFLVGKA